MTKAMQFKYRTQQKLPYQKEHTMLKNILCATSLLLATTFANADTITLTDNVAMQPTNYGTSLVFAQFDTMGGTRTLDSVTFSMTGSILGDARVESLDTDAITVNTTLSAELTLTDAMNNALVVTIPSVSRTFDASAFDGISDFGGTSGTTFTGLTASQFKSESYTDQTTLDFFTGAGVSTFSFTAAASSVATGSGNIISGLSTQASGVVNVIYNYTENAVSVSAPSHIALLGLGLLGFASLRKVRK